MKTFYKTIFVIAVAAGVYFFQDDIVRIYKNLYQNIIHQNAFTKALSAVNQGKDNLQNLTNDLLGPKKVTETPGALRVSDTLLVSSNGTNTLVAARVIAATNANRKSAADLPALVENVKLDASAQKKVNDMFTKQYFEHTSPSGVSVGDLADQVHYEYIIIGENLALGNFKDENALLTAWMNSPGHRANILNTHYTDIGVAVGRGLFEGKETWLAVQHFGLPRSTCPSINTLIKAAVQAGQKQLSDLQTELDALGKSIESGAVYEGMTREEQIAKYNGLVPAYNQLVKDMKIKIDEYNTQVKAFNDCANLSISKTAE